MTEGNSLLIIRHKECLIVNMSVSRTRLEVVFLISLILIFEKQATGNVGKVEMTRKFNNMPGSAPIPWKVPFPWPAERPILSDLSERQ